MKIRGTYLGKLVHWCIINIFADFIKIIIKMAKINCDELKTKENLLWQNNLKEYVSFALPLFPNLIE